MTAVLRAPAVFCALAVLAMLGSTTPAARADGDLYSALPEGWVAPAPAASRSIGYPWRGHLTGGHRLAESNVLRYVDEDAPRGNFYGTRALVRMVERAAAYVDREAPGARLNVGELSRRGGGNVMGHRSHENGRDVDLGLYLLDEAGVSVEPGRFVSVRSSGFGSWGGPVQFDAARNWLLIEAMLMDPDATLQHIFVARGIRRRLLREAARQHADPQLIERAEVVVMPPLGSDHPHTNHFHVRIYCPAGDVPLCRDRGPFHPWLPAAHPFAPTPEAEGEPIARR